MAEKIQYIPGRIKSAVKGGFVTGAIDIFDDLIRMPQGDINMMIVAYIASGGDIEEYKRIIAEISGTSVPVGGQTGLVLKKNSDEDLDVGWGTVADVAYSGSYNDLTDKPVIPEGVSPYTETPLMNGEASAGSVNLYSRGDHVHPSDTSKANVSELKIEDISGVSDKKKITLKNGTSQDVLIEHQDISHKVDDTITVNGHPLNENVEVTKEDIGLGNVDNKSSETIRGELTSSNVTTALGFTPLDSAEKGAINGVAELNANGKLSPSQLPLDVQSDWSQSDNSQVDYIKNKPDIYTKMEVNALIETEETRATAAEGANTNAITAINGKIPSEASTSNQLADKNFVNSSIATATATFRGTYNLISDLHLAIEATHTLIGTALSSAVSGEDNNDYAFVQIPTSTTSPTEISVIERYKYDGTDWQFEYALNNSGFTASQWAAINSGITSSLVGKLDALPTYIELNNMLNGKQDVINDLETIRSGASAGATAYQKPSVGIPKTDLDSSVQTSLGKADTALQSFTETDPTVPSWAKETNKPTYTLDEVDDGSTRKLSDYVPKTRKVNDKTLSSDITLTASDVGALPDSTIIPTVNNATLTIKKNASDTGDTFTANASQDKTINLDLATVATSGSYNDLSNKPHIPNDQVQSDWGETGTGEPSYIKNKPELATVATSGSYDDLSNKPSIPSTASDVGAVPITRKVNNKALSNDITLTASDVSALPSNTHIPVDPVLSDLDELDSTLLSFIRNKPHFISEEDFEPGTLFTKGSLLTVNGITYHALRDTYDLPVTFVVANGVPISDIYFGRVYYEIDEDAGLSQDWEVWIDASNDMRFKEIEHRVHSIESNKNILRLLEKVELITGEDLTDITITATPDSWSGNEGCNIHIVIGNSNNYTFDEMSLYIGDELIARETGVNSYECDEVVNSTATVRCLAKILGRVYNKSITVTKTNS